MRKRRNDEAGAPAEGAPAEPVDQQPASPSDAQAPDAAPTAEAAGISRRAFFGGAVASAAAGAAIGVVATGVTDQAAEASESTANPSPNDTSLDFYGVHQAGIQTPPQDHLVLMVFDVTTTSASELQVMLAKWSAAMAQYTKGLPVGAVEPDRDQAVPGDTGEAYGMGPNELTLTLGFAPSMFDERFGWAKYKPAALNPLPAFASDALTPEFTGGDICIQACAADPQVAYHAIRNLARMARTTATTRWTVQGFGRASAGQGQTTPRNLMGFKDGTRNIKEQTDLDEFVWVGSGSDQSWMTGGSYLVARKIHMLIETWDADYIGDQNTVFGRSKSSGAPLTGSGEFDTPDFTVKGADGQQVISPTAHVALAAHENNGGVKILRRGYNFTDGIDSVGRLDAGLMFLSYQKDPAQFVTIQSRLGSSDRLNEYIRHVGSGVFAVPPGLTGAGDYYGKALFI
ncbi:iron uptake transporter deferrochelatase/peroxidase subunit [Subtercola endophyticus]|uniref:iron uptake transporter deferrochelatase/peroxidase subunit n=1 Tax=Subtercola endophyticus TaxID=2895559 RepID=UPI001E5CADC0|nr:iron uptake transporter deferrochelatase/peroxidase subunit [Subtercola endophyticus]UFS59901.1 iron uptake transporter deferrochelatase/peroxidase subunit [Subtercola endophyticus]